jgi:hypothetical protein
VKAYHDLSSLVFADKPLGDRTSDVVAYVKESLQPALDKVVEILQATKETVEDKAQEEGVDVGAVKGKAEGVKGKAEGKAKEVCYFFSRLLSLSFFLFHLLLALECWETDPLVLSFVALGRESKSSRALRRRRSRRPRRPPPRCVPFFCLSL